MTDQSTADETAVDRAASTTTNNLQALTPRRILALFSIFGFLFLGSELGPVTIPYTVGILAFIFLTIASIHTWNRSGEFTPIDGLVAAHVVIAAVLVLTQLSLLDLPGTEQWIELGLLTLLLADGFIAHSPSPGS